MAGSTLGKIVTKICIGLLSKVQVLFLGFSSPNLYFIHSTLAIIVQKACTVVTMHFSEQLNIDTMIGWFSFPKYA